MYLGELIDALEKLPQDKVVPYGFGKPHSWRGSYYDVAFEPRGNVLVADMLADAKSALGTTYEGWKGGDFTMAEYTDVHISHEGTSSDLALEMVLNYMGDC